MTPSSIRWALSKGRIQCAGRGVYVQGSEPVTPLERAAATVIATDGVACGTLAGILHELDAIPLRPPFAIVAFGRKSIRPGARQGDLPSDAVVIVQGYRCTDGLRTMLDLAAVIDDNNWEQALESALRKRLVTVEQLQESLAARRRGNKRIRRVLALRPSGAPPTGSLLETLMVQLIRRAPHLPDPDRQLDVVNAHGDFCGRPDLAWPGVGLFVELDGQQHLNQPKYDARRETAIVAATGWLVARFTWDEVVYNPRATLRRLVEIYEQALKRKP